ncbi:DUF4942 domain-containing protein [Cytobacillus gottheilii]|uniref:DUF4942 domain-containing protein n=1 Tax=Cytobacillus gottheilii TaxID=859144 RepID=UPI0009BC3273|nr:DUF4942 domain-containing protein [Cytobacillus gottheilii]
MFNENPDFFPTPIQLIHKMLNKIDWKSGIKSILEPSGGKGDLIEAIHNRFKNSQYHHNRKKYDIDTCEIDPNLQAILKSKGHRLVHDDFLSYETYKKYDAIIANFPFSDGDKHLLKSIEMQSQGGEIVALINADTIRNTYSNTRKDLIRKLEELNAEVEFIENAFITAERKTGVTVALIHIAVPKIENNSILLDELKKEELHETKNEYNSRTLIESDFIRGIVQQYNFEIKAGLKLIEEYDKLKPLMLTSFNDNSNPVLKLSLEYEDKDGSSLENAYIKQIRSKYWKTLFSNDQFMSLFTSNLKQKYLQKVDELRDYDFSFYNIYTLRIELSKEMTQGVEDTIMELFEELTNKYHYYDETSKNIHYFNGWATNKCYKINKRVIIPLNAYDSWSGRFEPNGYKIKDKLTDIEKAFNYLDGGRTEEIDITEALKMAQHYQETKKIDLKFYTISFFKKGTAHLEFKDMELLHKLNLHAARSKNWLPPTYGKTKYKDMTAEEKQTIDEFEGENSYNKVMNNKQYYFIETSKLLQLTS